MRDKLIHVAIAKFGTRGFDAVGTREIAAAVGTPMSSITYHFGGKEGLYLAAAEHIFDHLRTHVVPRLGDAPAPNASPDQQATAICIALRAIGTFMLSEDSAPFSLFIGREQQDPTPQVLNLMRERIMPMMHSLVTQVSALRPDLAPDQAKAITVYLFGMAVALRHSRASLGLLLGTQEIDTKTQAMLLDQLEQSARAILTEPAQ